MFSKIPFVKELEGYWGSQDLRDKIQKEGMLIKVSLTFCTLLFPQDIFGMEHETEKPAD